MESLSSRYIPPTFEQSGSTPITVLRGQHKGQVAYIIGKGPSLLKLRPQDIGLGFVIVLNEAIEIVQRLGLPNRIYSMQKDGCATADQYNIPRPCSTCGEHNYRRAPLIDPLPGIAVVFSRYLSSWCMHGRPNRFVFDDAEFGYGDTPHVMSVLEAIPLAAYMGATSIVMVSFDHLMSGNAKYAFEYAEKDLAAAQRNLEWVRPRVFEKLREFGPHSFFIPK